MEVDFDNFDEEDLGEGDSAMQSLQYINEHSANEVGNASHMSAPQAS